VAPDTLMISGTASIVGHTSQHAGNAAAQVDEIFVNLERLLQGAHARAPTLSPCFSAGSSIKAYVRNRADLQTVEAKLQANLPAGASYLVLHGDVCRSDLLVEFDCLHAVTWTRPEIQGAASSGGIT
jgi:chorismate lyase/3-hydroxybenzoate synthase